MHAAILRFPVLVLIAALLAAPLMITGESLWTDEACTALFALQPDLDSWWSYLVRNTASDCQMPLSMFLAWVTGQVIGSGEWQLRVINALWAAISLGGMWRAGILLRLPLLPVALAIQPYFWSYTNEARPYALQLACGAWLLVAVLELLSEQGARRQWAVTFAVASVVLCYATLLAPIALVACLVGVAVRFGQSLKAVGYKDLLPLAAGGAAVLPAAFYYADTLARGARGSALWAVDFKASAFVIYEMVGLAGLGPPVDDLRGMAKSLSITAMVAAHPWPFVLASLAALGLGVIVFIGWRGISAGSERHVLLALGLPVVVGMVLFFGVSYALKKPFWARHLAPLFPFFVAFVAVAARSALRGTNRKVSLVIGLLVSGLLAASSLNLRFNPGYRNEDYRTAAFQARSALDRGERVWWYGSLLCAEYYGLPLTRGVEEPRAARHPELADAEAMANRSDERTPPDMVLVNHRHDADGGGDFDRKMTESGYRSEHGIHGFTVWKKERHHD